MLACSRSLSACSRSAGRRADDNGKRPETLTSPSRTSVSAEIAGETPFDVTYLSENSKGLIAFRPSVTLRRTQAPHAIALLCAELGCDIPTIAKELGIDPPALGGLELRLDQIDWMIADIDFDRAGKADGGQAMHRLRIAGPAVRTIKPFDWLAFLRAWHFELTEVRAEDYTYFQIGGIIKHRLGGKSPCVYLPDDRTIVFKEEGEIREMLTRTKPVAPAYLAGPEWKQFSREILVVAIDNRDGKFAKTYDLGRPDDAVVISLFKGVDRLILGVVDSDSFGIHAYAACRQEDNAMVVRSVRALIKMARDAFARSGTARTPGDDIERADRMVRDLLTYIRVIPDDHSVDVRSQGTATLAEFGSVMTGVIKDQAREGGIRIP